MRIEVLLNLAQGQNLPMTNATTISPLRQRMIGHHNYSGASSQHNALSLALIASDHRPPRPRPLGFESRGQQLLALSEKEN